MLQKRMSQPEALLLLGPTGSGKTPLGDALERSGLWKRRCHHFDFGANLRAIVAGEVTEDFANEEIAFLRRVLEEGALLEDERFPLAARILDRFMTRRRFQPGDLLLLNGLPRHLEQARAIDRKTAVVGVIQLDCDAGTVLERLRRDSGGDRSQRTDDNEELVASKLAIYEVRTRPLLEHYQRLGVRILRFEVRVDTGALEIVNGLENYPP